MNVKRFFTFLLPAALILAIGSCKHECPDPPMDPENPVCDTNDITYWGTVYPIFQENCIVCHSGDPPEGNLDLTDYDQVAFVAQNGALLGAIKHEPGFSPMPKGAAKLDSCDILKIGIWIRDTTFSTGPEPHPCDPDTIYFERDLLPILQSGCAQPGCHDATAVEGIRLDSYAAVMASDVVVPNNSDESEMFEKITEDDPEKRMPPPPQQPFNAEQIEIVRKWIDQGAQNLFCDEMCDSVNVTYSQTIWDGIISKHCTGCHKNPSPLGGLALETYEDVAAIASDGRLLGVVTHAAGFSPMPKNAARLNDCKIAQIRKWIDDGIPNN
jgi:mono/diheme cytochrome c family protein